MKAINKTKTDDFFQRLSRFSGFSDDECKTWTVIATIQDCIDRLLNDDKMMKADNSYSLSEQISMTKNVLFYNLFLVAIIPHGFEEKLYEIADLNLI